MNYTKDQLRAKIRKGMGLLSAEGRVIFTVWTRAYGRDHGLGQHSTAKWRKADLEAAYEQCAEIYRAQTRKTADAKYDRKTRVLPEHKAALAKAAKKRAAQIAELMEAAKERAIATGEAVKVVLPERLRG